jgi:aryl-alcohol dehydrogenase-like predicted oxidoreductase
MQSTRDAEADLVPVCRELGIGMVAYSPLGRGFLTGAITCPEDLPADDSRRNYPRYQGEAFVKARHKLARQGSGTGAAAALHCIGGFPACILFLCACRWWSLLAVCAQCKHTVI